MMLHFEVMLPTSANQPSVCVLGERDETEEDPGAGGPNSEPQECLLFLLLSMADPVFKNCII